MSAPKSWVYFIQEGTDGPIKIGHTSGDPRSRLAALQTGNPRPLQFLGAIPGTSQLESEWHGRLAADRMQGEWFRPTPTVLEEVQLALRQDGAIVCREDDPSAAGGHGVAYISEHIWGDLRFAELPDIERVLFLFIISGPHSSRLPGLWVIQSEDMAKRIGATVSHAVRAVRRLSESGLLSYNRNVEVVHVPGAIRRPGNPRVLRAWFHAWLGIPACEQKREYVRGIYGQIGTDAEALQTAWGHTFGRYNSDLPEAIP